MEWNEPLINRLRSLWDKGLSTAAIGRELGVSKNSVVGKAHRLDLPERPSPIKRLYNTPKAPPRPKRAGATTLPPLASAVTALAAPVPSKPAPAVRRIQPLPVRPVETAAPIIVCKEQPRRRFDGSGCCFPIGEPGTRNFRYCDADLDISGDYCPDHHKLTVIKLVRPSRAAA